MKKNFEKLISTLQDSIFTWNYFTDFKKAKNNIKKIERELNLLNSLIGKEVPEKVVVFLHSSCVMTKTSLPMLQRY